MPGALSCSEGALRRLVFFSEIAIVCGLHCGDSGPLMAKEDARAVEALTTINKVLSALDDQSRQRVIDSVITFFGHNRARSEDLQARVSTPSSPRPQFSEDHRPSPKEFLFQKQPKTDVERMACLAFYLTHFRDTPHFKTLDLAKLNTEAAQTKFSNAAYAANNATSSGYLAPAPKGQRQITAAGEQFVAALPDREAAQNAMAAARRRKNPRRKK